MERKKIFNSTKICIKASLLLPDIEPLTEKVFDSEILSANISISPNFCLQLGQSAGRGPKESHTRKGRH